MAHNNKEVLEYWNKEEVESMYDKHLINAEIALILSKLTSGSKILDAGCGEGEGTLEYAQIDDVSIHAVDFSETRLSKAKKRLTNCSNVSFQQVDFLSNYNLDNDFDFIIAQRFLINLMEWDLQKKVILDLVAHLKEGGRFLMFEGSRDGVDALNSLREIFGLDPIEVKWHNLFFDHKQIEELIEENNLKLVEKDGLGAYFLLTRGVRPILEEDLSWDTEFNEAAGSKEMKELLNLKEKFSRLVLWVIEK
jgi:ubiquinone/menaquinone biosynthesis C-methylase UbiE